MYTMLQSSRAYLYQSAEMFDAGIKSNVVFVASFPFIILDGFWVTLGKPNVVEV